jgi:uncharacterized SAM-binding protein YcdF (DUF218 family)
MKTFKGHLKITTENQNNKDWQDLETVSGSVDVRENARFSAPKLKTVSSSVYVRENARFSAPNLKQSGSVYVHENARFSAPNLKQSSSVYVHENARFSAPNLKQSGYVDVRENTRFSAPKLKTVSGYVDVHENARFSAPNLKQSGYVDVHENARFSAPKLETVSGSVDVRENARFSAPNLKQSGSVDVHENARLEKQLWKIASKNKWYINLKSSDWLIAKNGNFEYIINGIIFDRELFLKVRDEKLSPQEIFALTNIEQRRVAYELLDKTKMKDLNGKVLDENTDKYGNPEKVIEFKVDNLKNPLKFFQCVCPSTKREYFIETDETTCLKAKAKSFGVDDVEWVEEW